MKRLRKTKMTAKSRVKFCTIIQSRSTAPCAKAEPKPGKPKAFSTATEPLNNPASASPESVITGNNAFLSTWRSRRVRLASPLARAAAAPGWCAVAQFALDRASLHHAQRLVEQGGERGMVVLGGAGGSRDQPGRSHRARSQREGSVPRPRLGVHRGGRSSASTVRDPDGDALDDDEVADGWVVTCQSIPTSPTVKVVYE